MNIKFRLIWSRALGRPVIARTSSLKDDNSVAKVSASAGKVASNPLSRIRKLYPLALFAALAPVGSAIAYEAGPGSVGSGQDAVAVGVNTQASAENSYAAGTKAAASSAASIAIGLNAKTTIVEGAIAIGNEAQASGPEDSGLGVTLVAFRPDGPGYNKETQDTLPGPSTAIGSKANAFNGGTSIGSNAYSERAGTAIGINARAEGGDGATALGGGAYAQQEAATALGVQSYAGGAASTAIGGGALAYDAGTLAAGQLAQAKGSGSTALGNNSQAEGDDAIALGRGKATAKRAMALGAVSEASGEGSIALGDGTESTALYSIAVGHNSAVAGKYGVGIGAASQATADGTIGIGIQAAATSGLSIAIGAQTKASGLNSTVLGAKASSDQEDGVALGGGASVTAKNSVALGAASTATGETLANAAFQPKDSAGNPIEVAGATPAGEVSVGKKDSERRITNLAAGSADTDAVNVSQLNAIDSKIKSSGWKYTVNGDAQTNVNSGDTVNFANSDNNIVINKDPEGNDLTFNLAKNVTVDSLKAGDVVVSGDGINMGDTKITGLGKGAVNADSKEGINGSQLFGFASNVGSVIGGNTQVNPDTGEITLDDLGGTGKNNIHDALTAIKESSGGSSSWTLSDSEGNSTVIGKNGTVTISGDDNVTVTHGGEENNGKMSVKLNPDLKVTSVTAGDNVFNGDGLKVGQGDTGVVVAADGINLGGNKVTNVAKGDVNKDSADAVNGSQLWSLQDQIDNLQVGGEGNPYFNAKSEGDAAKAEGAESVAMGPASVASGDNSIAGGNGAAAEGKDSIAFGAGAKASDDNSVALGANSTTGPAVATKVINLGGKEYAVAGTEPVGTVSIGSEGKERTLTNLAAGRVSETSTDAVNGSQLHVTNQALGELDDRAVKYDLNDDGSVNYDKATLAGGDKGTALTNVANGKVEKDSLDAVNGGQLWALQDQINSAGNPYFDANSEGEAAKAEGAESVAMGPASVATGDNSIAGGNGAVAEGKDSIAFGAGAKASDENSVALGANSTTGPAIATKVITLGGKEYAVAGTEPVGTVSIGSEGKERTLTNLAAGRVSETSTDAVNGSQLHATNQALGELDDRAVKYDLNDDGSVNYDKATLAGGDKGTALANVANGKVEKDSLDAVNGGQLWALQDQINNVSAGEGSPYFTAKSTGPAAKAEGNDSVSIGPKSVARSEGGVALGAGSEATRAGLNGAKEAFSGTSVASTQGAVSVGSKGGERQITNVAGGTEATDAVNVRQLSAVQAGAVNYDRKSDGSPDYSSVTLGNKNSGPAQIHNVAPGTADTDAANVGQLKAIDQGIGRRFNSLNKRIDDVEDKANAGTASAIAAASIPQAYLPGNSMVAAGLAGYEDQAAVAVGISRLSDNGRWAVKLNATGDTQSNFGAGVGVGFQW